MYFVHIVIGGAHYCSYSTNCMVS